SILPAANILPGVRMEERSPGSYRFSIRGSSLRSPFGVRNVKAYWNGLPFTDGGGNTYLNLLDFSSVGSIEIIKGPAASLYGAGTGGVLLMKSPRVAGNQLQASAVIGSYGLQRYLIGGQLKNDNVSANVQFAHHKSDGYREQTALKRNALNADVIVRTGERGTLTSTLVFSNLFYETPGGLTLEQYEQDPAQARPPSVSLGAVEAKAAVTNETVFGGVVYDYDWNNQWTTSTGVYGAFSAFENPTIRNYEARDETNFGFRSQTDYRLFRNQSSVGGKITFGGEYQYFISPIAVFDNDGAGKPAAVQVRDEVTSSAGLVFTQTQFDFGNTFFVTAGLSANFLKYGFERIEPAPALEQDRSFDVVVSPRFAMLKKFSDGLSLFASYSDGFSPPSLAEVRPSTNTFSNTLKAEIGNNIELGARGVVGNSRLGYDVVIYDFRLRNTIVVQRNEEGADYFINAGKTSQRGLEALVSYDFAAASEFVSEFKLWGSYAYQHYRFKEYLDFAGNALTGIAPTTASAGLDLTLNKKFTSNVTASYVDHIPLNDANTAFAEEYVLIGLRLGWNARIFESNRLQLFAGVDNLLDESYSLGNDLNAFGGRYYNAAMPRNYYAGLTFILGGEE
ncbi:MAG TPA: TonB-dependent receptor, partial [Chryseosolibacter sp.]|nr:TonB-dependent receptor [Chryseosolibacter sp.]